MKRIYGQSAKTLGMRAPNEEVAIFREMAAAEGVPVSVFILRCVRARAALYLRCRARPIPWEENCNG